MHQILKNKNTPAVDANSCHKFRGLIHDLAESLGEAVDAKDHYTRHHSVEVAEIAYIIAEQLRLPGEGAELIHIAGHLHDLGKIGVPDHILNKQGPLTQAEWETLLRHPEIGANILRPVTDIAASGLVEMVLHHHERFDGRGYPHGLTGKAIPLGSRVIALADSLSAMLGRRPYRSPMSFEAAIDEIVRCKGRQFDPMVVDAFLERQDGVRVLLRKLGANDNCFAAPGPKVHCSVPAAGIVSTKPRARPLGNRKVR